MAGAQIEIVANQIEAQRLGYQAISLTHYEDTDEPQIAAGSKVEIGGALFEFSGNESITGWGGIGNSTDVYIKLTVSGTSVTAAFTTSAPSWDTAKQGWYGGAERYVFYLRKDGSGNYADKAILPDAPHRQLEGARLILPFYVGTGAEQNYSSDVRASTTSIDYVQLKELVIPFSGTVNLYFEVGSTGGYTAYGRIYKNGVAVGTQRTGDTSPDAYDEDIAVTRGDRLQLYAKIQAGGTASAFVQNFRIRANRSLAGTLFEILPVFTQQ